MSREEILAELQKVFERVTGQKDVTLTKGMIINSAPGLTSFLLVQLVCEIEDAFDIEISNKDIRKLKTTDDIVGVIEKQLGRKP